MVLCTSTGAVELEKLPLKKDALKKLKLPFDIKSGGLKALIFSSYLVYFV